MATSEQAEALAGRLNELLDGEELTHVVEALAIMFLGVAINIQSEEPGHQSAKNLATYIRNLADQIEERDH